MPINIYITLLLIVDCALIYSLFAWWKIVQKTTGKENLSAKLFLTCFALYVIGQTMVLLQTLEIIDLGMDYSGYFYALAAILFAVGSYFRLKS